MFLHSSLNHQCIALYVLKLQSFDQKNYAFKYDLNETLLVDIELIFILFYLSYTIIKISLYYITSYQHLSYFMSM